MPRKGFLFLFPLIVLVILFLKVYIIYRAFNMFEEASRKEMGLEPKATPTEVVGDEIEKLIETLEKETQ